MLQLQQLQKKLLRDTAFMMVAIVSFIYHTLVTLILMLRLTVTKVEITQSEPSLLAAQQIPGVDAAPAVWQNHQAAPMYPGSKHAAAAPAQVPDGQVPSWNPSAQAWTTTYVSVAGTFPGQTYLAFPVPAYSTAPTPAGLSPLSQPAMSITQPRVQPASPDGALPPGHPT